MYSTSKLENTKNYSKRLAKALLGRDHLYVSNTRIKKVRLGSRYGGWFIAPTALPTLRVPTVLSFGIGDDISFDLEMIRVFNARVFAFDPTPKSLEWLSEQSNLPGSFKAFPFGVAGFDGIQKFSLPTVADWDDYSIRRQSPQTIECTVKRVETLLQELQLEQIDLIKMDIEGSEYEVLPDLLRSSIVPRQLLVEFHHGRDGITVAETRAMVSALRGVGYRIFDVSPWGREFSFVHYST
jgi:FkbM family methyltransferase